MFHLFFILLSLSIHLFFLLTTNIEIPTEIYFFSHLVNKGLVPYKDFFDHHGFLLYFLLAPLTIDKNFLLLKLFYILLQGVNLGLVLLITKKISNELGFVMVSIFYPLLNFFNSKNVLWYETIITTFYLLIFYLLIEKKFKYRDYLIGFIIGLSSLVKPQTTILLIFLLIFTKSSKIFLGFFSVWLITFAYFFTNQALSKLLNNLFLFNLFLAKNYPISTFPDFDGKKVLIILIFLIIFSYLSFFLTKKIISGALPLYKIIPISIFLLVSLSSTTTGLAEVAHLLPFITFSLILLSLTLKAVKKNNRKIFILFLITFFIFLTQKTFQFYQQTKARIPSINNEEANNIVKQLQNEGIVKDNLFVIGGYVQIYYKLNQLPPTYFPLEFPLINFHFPDYQEKILSDLKNSQVKYIVVLNNDAQYSENDLSLKRKIQKNYKPFKSFTNFTIFTY